MKGKAKTLLEISGASGIVAPVVAFTFVLVAIASYPEFSWTENALSDLGVKAGATAILFNCGLVIGGGLALVFALGLCTYLGGKLLGRIGTLIFVLDILALIAVAVFPENVEPAHYYASVAFFAFFPLSMLVICAAFLLMAQVKMALFTFLSAISMVIVWIIQFTVQFSPGVAIPETLSALSMSMWVIVLGIQILKRPSQCVSRTSLFFCS